LIRNFKDRTGWRALVNTSFNVRGELVVCTPEDAFRCFMGTQIELLIVGNALFYNSLQPTSATEDYKANYEMD